MTVDFHVHSTASDGTLTPSELIGRARGFAALALTDHDNCDGVAEAATAAGGGGGLRFFAGVELSVCPGDGFDKFHLLAIGADPADPELTALLRRILAGRNERNRRITENFARLGIVMDDISAYAHGEVLARPHYARWLVEHGFARDIPEAFAKYLLPESPAETRCYEERYRPMPEEAIAAVHAAGGLAVMAHPKYWCRVWSRTGPDFSRAAAELSRLREMGLDGLEARYQANTPEEDVGFAMIADRVGLLKSAGSDFHGANKRTIELGMEVSDTFISPLLERLGDRCEN